MRQKLEIIVSTFLLDTSEKILRLALLSKIRCWFVFGKTITTRWKKKTIILMLLFGWSVSFSVFRFIQEFFLDRHFVGCFKTLIWFSDLYPHACCFFLKITFCRKKKEWKVTKNFGGIKLDEILQILRRFWLR